VISLAKISVSPVKGFRLHHPERVELGPDGVVENRRFFVVDAEGQRKRTSTTAWLALVLERLEAVAAQVAGDDVPDDRLVVDDEDPAHGRHFAWCSSAQSRRTVPTVIPRSEWRVAGWMTAR
jgi:uncharacterized protein YcbX